MEIFYLKIHPDTEDATASAIAAGGASYNVRQSTVYAAEPETGSTDG